MSYKNDRITAIPAPLPKDYDRQTRFVDYETQFPHKPKRGQDLDAEFNAIEQAVDETQDRLALIQRDDGAIRNKSVGLDQLKEETQVGVNAPDDWATFTNYAANDSVIVGGGAWYIAVESHVSSGTFQDDLDAGYWRLLLNLTPYTVEAKNWATRAEDDPVPEGDGTEYSAEHHAAKSAASASAAATSESNASSSASAASTSETNAANSASSAATSENNAANSETNASNSAAAASTSETNAADEAIYAAEWATAAEDTPVSTAAGGDGSTDYSALHHAAKAATSAASVNAVNIVHAPGSGLANEAGAAYAKNVGLAENEVPTNSDLGSAATANVGLGDSEVPTSASVFVARHYDAGGVHEAAGQTTIQTPEEVQLRIGSMAYVLTTQTSLDVNTSTNWDDGTNATPASRAGKDFYLYYCQPASGSEPDLIFSANATMPTSIPSGATPTADNTRKVAGFHCLCADVGTISGHPLSGFVTGDVLPRSVWDQFHRPESEPEGMVYSNAGKWVDIYLASVSGGELASVNGATIADGASAEAFHWYKFDQWMRRIKKRLPFQGEFVDFSIGSNQGTNIAGSADPTTTGGHSDTAGRRMISDIGCEDCAGALWQWGIEGGATNDVGSAWADAYDSNDSGVAGEHYEAPNRPLFGGNWLDGSKCGSRGSYWNDSPLILSSLVSTRGVAEPAKNRRI